MPSASRTPVMATCERASSLSCAAPFSPCDCTGSKPTSSPATTPRSHSPAAPAFAARDSRRGTSRSAAAGVTTSAGRSLPRNGATATSTPETASIAPWRSKAPCQSVVRLVLSEYPRQAEVREGAVAAEPGDRGDLLALERQDDHSVQAGDLGLGRWEVDAECR